MATKLCTRCYAGMDTDGDGDCGVCAKLTDRQLAGIQDAAQKFKLPYAPTRPARETFITNAMEASQGTPLNVDTYSHQVADYALRLLHEANRR